MLRKTIQFNRAQTVEKVCFTECDGSCYGDYINEHMKCFDFCFEMARRLGKLR